MAIAFPEGAVTRARRERKLVLSRGDSAEVCAHLAEALDVPAGPLTQITCIYFDAPDLPLAARAIAVPEDCIKLRTREYFPDSSGASVDRVVLELKHVRAGLTRKSRWWIPRAALGQGPAEAPEELLRLVRGRLLPVLAVTYVRRVFQRSDAWRVTVDGEICFHRVDAALALGPRRLSRSELPPPFSRDEAIVVELKHRDRALPPELESLAGRPARYSKFAEGMKRRAQAAAGGQGETRGCSSTSRESTAAERPPSRTGSPRG